jgi:hypothetical protein
MIPQVISLMTRHPTVSAYEIARGSESKEEMARLEELTRDAAVRGILPDCLVTVVVVDVKWHGQVVEL